MSRSHGRAKDGTIVRVPSWGRVREQPRRGTPDSDEEFLHIRLYLAREVRICGYSPLRFSTLTDRST
jgi:hypothetical protein